MVDQSVPKTKNPRKRKGANDQDGHNVEASTKKESQDIIIDETPEEIQVPENDENEEISISYITTRKRWNRKDTVVNNTFVYNIAIKIIKQDVRLEPKCIEECR